MWKNHILNLLMVYIIMHEVFKSSYLLQSYFECISILCLRGRSYHTSAKILTFFQYVDISVIFAYMQLVSDILHAPCIPYQKRIKNLNTFLRMKNHVIFHALDAVTKKYKYDERLFNEFVMSMKKNAKDEITCKTWVENMEYCKSVIGEFILPILYSNIPFVKKYGDLREAFRVANILVGNKKTNEETYKGMISKSRNLAYAFQLTSQIHFFTITVCEMDAIQIHCTLF